MDFSYQADAKFDDLENDEELLAELMALQDEDGSKEINTVEISTNKRPKVDLVSREPTKEVASVPVYEIPEFVSDDEHSIDLNEEDLNDEGLLSELHQLAEGTKEGPVAQKQVPTQEQQKSVHKEEVPSDPRPTKPVPQTAPKLIPKNILPEEGIKPEQSAGLVAVEQKASESVKRAPAPTEESKAATTSSLENRAQNLLMRRRKLYLERSVAAKNAKDSTAALEAFETVKLFNQALEAVKQGAQLSEEDLEQVPPSPPVYRSSSSASPAPPSAPVVTPKPSTSCQTSASGQPKKVPPFDEAITANAHMSEELRLVLMRQQQLKLEAMEAKKRGDMVKAKEFLLMAHRMNQMVEAAKCGLSVDVRQIPVIQSRHSPLPSEKTTITPLSFTVDAESAKKCRILERELLKQIALCEERAKRFQSTGKSKNTLLYESLLQQSKRDLQRVQSAALGKAMIPGFKLLELSLPLIELNPAISEDVLELRMNKVENLKLPEGWKPCHCALYVSYRFPFPHTAHQTGRTLTVKGTTSPEFPDVFQLDINRKSKQLLRVCMRQPIKIEVYQKGGFLRSDKLFGYADVSLQKLENNATIEGKFDILESRKKTGGQIHVQIRIGRPLGEKGSSNCANDLAKQKWIKLLEA